MVVKYIVCVGYTYGTTYMYRIYTHQVTVIYTCTLYKMFWPHSTVYVQSSVNCEAPPD